MEIIPLEDQHIDQVLDNLREEEARAIEIMGGVDHAKFIISQMKDRTIGMSFVDEEGDAKAIWFIINLWKGVVEIAAYTSAECDNQKLDFYKASKRGLRYVIEELSPHRIQAHVWSGYDRSIEWLKSLGFEVEGVMKQYGPGRIDATIMGRII